MATRRGALAEQLDDENTRRQAEEADIVAEARKIVETDPDVGAHNVLVVAGDGWHRGVIGIVASKLVDAFHKPAIVLSIDGRRGARLVPQHPRLRHARRARGLRGPVRQVRRAQAGGRPDDGPAERIPEFRDRVNAHGPRLEPDDLIPRLRLDGVLPLAGIDSRVVAGLEQLAPFGLANAQPVFDAPGVELLGRPPDQRRHLKVQFVRTDGSSTRLRGVRRRRPRNGSSTGNRSASRTRSTSRRFGARRRSS